MPEVSICFNIQEPSDYDTYCKRMALFSGSGKKYSITYITPREEKKAQSFKDLFEKLKVTTFPESLDKLIASVTAD
jgi:hypothetical protein